MPESLPVTSRNNPTLTPQQCVLLEKKVHSHSLVVSACLFSGSKNMIWINRKQLHTFPNWKREERKRKRTAQWVSRPMIVDPK